MIPFPRNARTGTLGDRACRKRMHFSVGVRRQEVSSLAVSDGNFTWPTPGLGADIDAALSAQAD